MIFRGASNGLVTGNIVEGTGAVSLSPFKDGTGMWTFTGTNTYTGITTVNGGLLIIRNDRNLGAVPAANTADRQASPVQRRSRRSTAHSKGQDDQDMQGTQAAEQSFASSVGVGMAASYFVPGSAFKIIAKLKKPEGNVKGRASKRGVENVG